jgi:16S rRNA (adenine1518-N6/adenine1519-N6)-dimethyltransferase
MPNQQNAGKPTENHYVKPKKHLGQHFLRDENIAEKIVRQLTFHNAYANVLEIGPGTGVLTRYLNDMNLENLVLFEIDRDSVAYLQKYYPDVEVREADFLKQDLREQFTGGVGVIGNFPYNISSQIFFSVLQHRNQVQEVVGMIQKEVADRICSREGSKIYGILSVLLQAWYHVEMLFTVPPGVFIPPPKVMSAVVRLTRNNVDQLDCDENLFFRVVKQGFQNRRKTLRNALKPLNLPEAVRNDPLLSRRAEQLSVKDFIHLTHRIKPTH